MHHVAEPGVADKPLELVARVGVAAELVGGAGEGGDPVLERGAVQRPVLGVVGEVEILELGPTADLKVPAPRVSGVVEVFRRAVAR